MKKIMLLILSLLLIGCSTIPTGEINSYINKYQSLDSDVISELDDFLDNTSLSIEILSLYKEVYLRQYRDLEYEIMDYKCNNNKCIIPIEIEVYDYLSVQKEALNYLASHESEFEDINGNYDVNLYEKYKLSLMSNVKDRVKYKINVNLKKELLSWHVLPFDNNDLLKIHGIYE